MRLRTLLVAAAAALLLVPCAVGSGAATPAELGLAKQLKGELQRFFTKKVPGTKLTVVTCKISSDQTSARCAAHFTRASLKGTYQVTVGNTSWQVMSVACTNAKTGAKVTKNCR
jgi:hypothetical protein